MDIETSSDEVMSSRYIPRSRPSIYENVTLFSQEPMYKKKKPRTPKTPPGTPPRRPTLTFITAAADTTQNRGVVSTSPDLTSLNPNGQKMKDSFRTKVCCVAIETKHFSGFPRDPAYVFGMTLSPRHDQKIRFPKHHSNTKPNRRPMTRVRVADNTREYFTSCVVFV